MSIMVIASPPNLSPGKSRATRTPAEPRRARLPNIAYPNCAYRKPNPEGTQDARAGIGLAATSTPHSPTVHASFGHPRRTLAPRQTVCGARVARAGLGVHASPDTV
ncbi:MAG: hypothetical protein F4027_17030 [Rhodospirillaceae bacterium]|nr:hypothetical protein [Rhodospirillaceae bacterium]